MFLSIYHYYLLWENLALQILKLTLSVSTLAIYVRILGCFRVFNRFTADLKEEQTFDSAKMSIKNE